MRLSYLINLIVRSEKTDHLFGLLRYAYAREGKIDRFVINPGSLFADSESFLPDTIVSVEEEYLDLGSEKDLIRMKKKDFEKAISGSLCLKDLPLCDVNGIRFGRLEDAVLDDAYNIFEYIVSRSFFDDLDEGFVIIPGNDIHLDVKTKTLMYNKERTQLPYDPRQSGLVRKIFGIEGKS